MDQKQTIVVTSKELTDTGNTAMSVGLTMVLFAGLKVWIFGPGVWSVLIILVGMYFAYAGAKFAQPGYDALSKAVDDNSK